MKLVTCVLGFFALLPLSSMAQDPKRPDENPPLQGEKRWPAGRQALGKFTILEKIQEDGARLAVARRNAAESLRKHPDLDAMIGVWAYNAPECLAAIREAGREKNVLVFSFDEAPAVLEAIQEGSCAGTIVQNPFQIGYKAIEHLKEFAIDGKTLQAPASQMVWVPCQTVTQKNVDEFLEKHTTERRLAEEKRPAALRGQVPTFAFITNVADPWWTHAEAGCYAAASKLNVSAKFIVNTDSDVESQNRILNEVLAEDSIVGVAVSALHPDAQRELLNRVASRKALVTVDSDVPDSKRLLYIGTNTYQSGRMMGRLIKERMPKGGNIMLYVGTMVPFNAQERCRGIFDELRETAEQPDPAED